MCDTVFDQDGDFGWGEPEIQWYGDGPDHVGGQHRLDELGAVKHQDHDPIAETDPATAQCARQRRNPAP
ncbi:Uncharacterised protein [Mycobacterium tuberculosis]|nr:Uncharacterised protein [Mycobacterium tuberculosis]